MKCKKCAGCCSRMIVEITHLDILREPQLAKHVDLLDGHGKIIFEDDMEKEYLLACGQLKPCAFLKDNKCKIYPTRPNVCVAFESGGEQCKLFQRAEGRPDVARIKTV